MCPLSPSNRSGSCCTTRPCQPCCGSGWRPATFTSRWPRSLCRAKMVTRLRPQDSPCWGKHKCPHNPPQPWLPPDWKVHKRLHMCAYACVCVCLTSVFDLSWTVIVACCVYLQRPRTAPLHNYLLSYFFSFFVVVVLCTWPDRDWELQVISLTQSQAIIPACFYCFKVEKCSHCLSKSLNTATPGCALTT